MFRNVLQQITESVVQCEHVKIKRDMREQIKGLALTQIKNNAKVLKSRASNNNRGRPRKLVETSVEAPVHVPSVVPSIPVPTVPTVPTKARGRPKKSVLVQKNFQVVPLTEFAK